MKLKALATAVALTLSAGAANAAIVTGTATDGELFLSVWDPSAETSYHLDLGITLSQFNADDAAPRSFDLASDANYSAFLGQTDLRYSITGQNNIPFTSIADLQTFGFMTTASDLTAFDAAMVDQGSISAAYVNINTQAALLNAAEGVPYATNGSNAGINNSAAVSVGQQGYFNVGTWGNTMGNRGFTMTADVDSSIAFYQVTLSDVDFASAVVTGMADWNLSSDGSLTYNAGVSEVPVPAAVWLFGSGLVGLVGIARRKKA